MTLHIIAGLIGSYAFISVAEYWIHGRWMHKPGKVGKYLAPDLFRNHQKVHHPAYQADYSSADPEKHAEVGLYLSLPHTLASIALPTLAFGVFFPIEASVFVGMVFVHHWVWNDVHPAFHGVGRSRLGSTFLYAYLNEYHEGHHKDWGKNLNVVAIGADFFFGTYRKP